MMKTEKIYLYGKNALKEALLAKPKCVQKVFLEKNVREDSELVGLLQKNNIAIADLKETNGRVERDAVHQGVIAQISADALYTPIEEVLRTIEGTPAFVLLDELQDPHNVGAIIRSAAAFDASAVLLPEHNQAPITGAVIKTSAGMVFRIPIVKIGNVNQTLRLLKEKGFWIYGLAGEGSSKLNEIAFDTPVIFVVGNEGDGIRQKTLELCDVTLSIPIDPRCESLNAAVATSVVLYEWSKKR
ncbi:MAG TPA: 23S rRNA (guanosine(2251)-2'-O)-methyltransferase RlmB [Candidatus Paceibacterota bacterium]|nr:23S rRNA (guanosine(2251)-2'-O)-methyltransferase RlmB [Candidatus Paceibacterota bacterium]